MFTRRHLHDKARQHLLSSTSLGATWLRTGPMAFHHKGDVTAGMYIVRTACCMANDEWPRNCKCQMLCMNMFNELHTVKFDQSWSVGGAAKVSINSICVLPQVTNVTRSSKRPGCCLVP